MTGDVNIQHMHIHIHIRSTHKYKDTLKKKREREKESDLLLLGKTKNAITPHGKELLCTCALREILLHDSQGVCK